MNITKRQICLELKFPTDYRENVFHVGPCNVEAYNWIVRWPYEFKTPFSCIFGPSGAGKTHLANIWRERHKGCVWITPEMIQGAPEDLVHQADYFVLDNADLIRDERWLFGLFNALQAIEKENKFWLMTAKKPPSRWSIILPDLKSRLNLCHTLGMILPDDSTCLAVFNKITRRK